MYDVFLFIMAFSIIVIVLSEPISDLIQKHKGD